MTSLRLITLLVLVAIAAGCPPGILRDSLEAPGDPCFRGDYSNEYFSLHMFHDLGDVVTSVIKESTSIAPWEGMSFVGKIVELGRADGVLTLNFPDNTSWQSGADYRIYLEPSSGECSMRNQVRFSLIAYDYHGVDYQFEYTLTRHP